MALENGKKLGPYEIVEPAGVGGMGEVYKARDTRLDRTVAIKVLPESMALNADLKSRFDREAKAISSLNHPNICTLHDIGSEEGIDFLVMEFLEGETLAERLTRGALPLTEVYDIAIEISDALDKAHRQGLIHRDLKPGNIMLTAEGARLMDFGLAKLQMADGQGKPAAQMTQTTPLTGAGTILGTLQYMAPEQLEGEEADARSDIFSFGVVLYEMLTGTKAFAGKSQASLIASIISTEPSAVSEIKPMTPPGLSRLVKKCLEKLPDNRWQSARDLADELRWMAQAGSQVGLPAHVARRRQFKFTVARVVGAVAIATSLVLAYLLFGQHPPEPVLQRFSIVPQLSTPELRSIDWARISPNGEYVAFQGTDTLGKTLIWVRPMSSLNPYPLRGTENAKRHFWSPDSKYIAFFQGSKLYKVAVDGGASQLICEAPSGADGTWGKSDYIIFDSRATDTLRYVSASGGEPLIVENLDSARGEIGSSWPWFLSDGEHFMYLVRETGARHTFKIGSLHSTESKVLFTSEELDHINARIEYSSQGYLLYMKDRILVAHKFDMQSLSVVGQPKPIAQGITRATNTFNYGTSDNGILLFQYQDQSDRSELIWLDREGNELGKEGDPGQYQDILLSPDGTQLVYQLTDPTTGKDDIWVRNLARGINTRLTFDPESEIVPIWSPDSRRVAYAKVVNDRGTTFTIRADGMGGVHPINMSDSVTTGPLSWFPDGESIVVNYLQKGWDIGMIGLSDTDTLIPLLNSQFEEWYGKLSPDGKYIAYTSTETGTEEVYIKQLGEHGARWQVSSGGGVAPNWTKGGQEFIYRTFEYDMLAIPVTYEGDRLLLGSPKVLFRYRYKPEDYGNNRYTVTADGEKFLFNTPTVAETPGQIVVVQNWFKEIEGSK